MGDALGAILGFGMADLEHRLRPLPKAIWQSGLRGGFQQGAKWTGSDFDYHVFSAQGSVSRTWGRHSRLALLAGGAQGDSLPFSQLIRSGPQLGMNGTYARELRGDRGFGSSLNFSRPFRMTRRGLWQGSLFAEGSMVRTHGESQSKTGLGASFFYMFWRFPMPLGLSYTYTFEDTDAQISAAIGGRF
jgi:hypothetical protein